MRASTWMSAGNAIWTHPWHELLPVSQYWSFEQVCDAVQVGGLEDETERPVAQDVHEGPFELGWNVQLVQPRGQAKGQQLTTVGNEGVLRISVYAPLQFPLASS
jgi:hypothetical protein